MDFSLDSLCKRYQEDSGIHRDYQQPEECAEREHGQQVEGSCNTALRQLVDTEKFSTY